MRDSIIIIGHSNHGKTVLSSALEVTLCSENKYAKNINEIIEDSKRIIFKAPPEAELTSLNYKDGRQNRRERRSKLRKKSNKKTK